MPERRTLLRNGHILSMDDTIGDLDRGDLLVEGDRIAAVGRDLDEPADEVVDASEMLVLPGLIDSHIHLWQAPLRGLAAECWAGEYYPTIHPLSGRYRPDDMRVATYGGAVEALSHGTTTVVDFCHSVNSPEHADASVAGLTDAGIRAFFGYSFRDRPEVDRRAFHSHDERVRDAHRVRAALPADDALVRMAIAFNNIPHVDADTMAREVGCARDLGVPATVHSHDAEEIDEMGRRGLLGPDILWVHQETAGPDQFELLARHGGAISVTPECEMGSGLFPVTGRALRQGVPVTLGVDIPSGMNADLLVQVRLAFHLDRMFDARRELTEGRPPARSDRIPSLSARDVLRLVTIDAARTLDLGDRTGSLAPGKQADVLLLSTPFGIGAGDAAAHVVQHASAADVDTVIVGGRIRKRAGRMLDVDESALRHQLLEVREHLLAERAAGERAAG